MKIPSIVLLSVLLSLYSCNESSTLEYDPTASLNPDSMFVFQPDWETLAEGEINMSEWIQKPAGKNGFISIKDGHFVTPDGERFRIWGVNLTAGACYPEKENAISVAKLLSALGVNAVRFHFLDSNWGKDKSIFRSDTNTTRVLDPVQLDKLDFFVSVLKEEGIYSNFNLNVGRNYREGDGVPFYNFLGIAKAVTLFDDRIIELEKEYASQLLSHVNPYTGKEYRNEPALAFLEIVNENSLVEAWFTGRLKGEHESTQTGTWIDIPPYYARELSNKYNEWLKHSLEPAELFELKKNLGLEQGALIPRLVPDEFSLASYRRFELEAKFIMHLESTFYSGMYDYLKNSIGARQLIAANSDHNHWKSGYALLSATSKLDFTDGHVYWQHPNYITDPQSGKGSFRIENTPMVDDPGMSSVVQLSRSALKGMPYTVSEANHPYPNEYAAEGIPVLAAYALFQDWDGIYFYTFEHDDPSNWKSKETGHFDILHDPVKLMSLSAVSLAFHRADVQAAKKTILRAYSEEDLIAGIREGHENKPMFTEGFHSWLPLEHATRIENFSKGKLQYPDYEPSFPILSDTEELSWSDGAVSINSPNSQALIGRKQALESMRSANMQASLENNFASLYLTSLSDEPIASSKRILLFAASSSILKASKWNKERTSLEDWGTRPFMIRPVCGIVKLDNIQGGKLKVYALDHGGNRIGEVPVLKQDRKNLHFQLGTEVTTWYLIE